jgi:hypothetical protein
MEGVTKELFEYWMGRLTRAMETLILCERQGLRMRSAKVQLRKINKVEWAEGVQIIVRRLDQAPEGMTVQELREYCRTAGYERFSKNLASAAKRRLSPLDELVRQKLVIMTRDVTRNGNTKFGARRYWTRSWYLRKYATLPEEWQEQAVEDAIREVDESSDDD